MFFILFQTKIENSADIKTDYNLEKSKCEIRTISFSFSFYVKLESYLRNYNKVNLNLVDYYSV